MTKKKSSNNNHDGKVGEPGTKIMDLLRDFGVRRRQNGSVWLSLRWDSLPGYLQELKITRQACNWIMVVSQGGQTVRCFQKHNDRN